MKAWEFKAVTYDGAVYCVGCLPEGISISEEGVVPIFVSDEWDYYPVCDVCGREHDYVGLTDYGRGENHGND